MLAPKRVKFRKRFKGRTKGMATRGNTLVFGHYALMVLEPGWITNRQIEAGRGGGAREVERGGKAGPGGLGGGGGGPRGAAARGGRGGPPHPPRVAGGGGGGRGKKGGGGGGEGGGGGGGGGGGRRKVRTGVVVSDKMTKTVTVSLVRRFAHGFYGKQVVRTKQVAAHNDKGAKAGDTVRIVETRPLSKTKRWRVVEVLERAR